MKASRLVGAGGAHAARLADVPRLDDPHTGESDARLVHQSSNDVLKDTLDTPFSGDPESQFLQSFELHDRT